MIKVSAHRSRMTGSELRANTVNTSTLTAVPRRRLNIRLASGEYMVDFRATKVLPLATYTVSSRGAFLAAARVRRALRVWNWHCAV